MQKAMRKEKLSPAREQHAFDLRTTLDWLRAEGDLIETDKAVDPDLEVTGLQKHMDGGCPILFRNVKGKPDQERAGHRKEDDCGEACNQRQPHGDAERFRPGDFAALGARAD